MDKIISKDALKAYKWGNLGDVKKGRSNLGEEMPVIVYRLMQYTLIDTLKEELGAEKAIICFRQAGHLAGIEFAKNMLNLDQDFNSFIAQLQEILKLLKIGILRVEAFDSESGTIILTIAEDLDCSGLPVTNENICHYDEGFISGILERYTGKKYKVREIDCWANGDRICRFKGVQI